MMRCKAEVLWLREGQAFLDNKYSRSHLLRFDGGAEVRASSSPHIVPVPMSDASAVDPEEAFVASLASCHMLWFLSIAAKRGFLVERYFDAAEGQMDRNTLGKMIMAVVTLKPQVDFSGTRAPTRAELDEMHYEAHEECFIANSEVGGALPTGIHPRLRRRVAAGLVTKQEARKGNVHIHRMKCS